jgi:hypothetical protein
MKKSPVQTPFPAWAFSNTGSIGAGISFILILVIGISCVDEIELDLDPQEYERLIVSGLVSDDDSVQTVILKKTMPYDRNEPNPPAEGAIVSIEVDNVHYFLEEVCTGRYESREFIGEKGKTYNLEILYDNQTYKASSTMYNGFVIDSIGFRRVAHIMPDQVPQFEILVYGQDSPEENQYYIFMTSLNDIWIDTMLKWGVYSDRFFNGEYLAGKSVRVIKTKASSVQVQIRSMSIPEDYFNFINDAIMNYMPNMFFSPPKVNVKGNVSNGALGFFVAGSVHYSEKRKLLKSDFPE